jgi:hypothetical protein
VLFFGDDEPGSAQKTELPRLSLPQNDLWVGVGNPWGYIGAELGGKWLGTCSQLGCLQDSQFGQGARASFYFTSWASNTWIWFKTGSLFWSFSFTDWPQPFGVLSFTEPACV